VNPFTLEGKVAIVTGGGKGIGATIAKVFSEFGASVAVTARTAADVDGVAAEINDAGGSAIGIQADLYDTDQLPGVVDRTVAAFGGVDVVVNNAGAGGSPAFVDTRVDDLERAFRLMVSSPFELTRLALPSMLERPGASVVNMTSVGYTRAARGNLAHWTAKSALAALTRLMAADLGPKIRVNAIAPGPVETPGFRGAIEGRGSEMRQMVMDTMRLKRMGTPEDVAWAALYLASPASAWITGIVLDMNGGPIDEHQARTPDL
jgi:7-alpha-hydroxysteroid dehydrogenase